MEAYRAYEKNVQQVISLRYNLFMEEPKEVKAADDRLLVTEQRDLMWGVTSAGNVQKERLHGILPLPETIVPWTPEQTERTFLMRFSELTGTTEFYKT
jgi:hypothetical protein